MKEKQTFHRDGSGTVTRVTDRTFKDGSSHRTVSRGTEGVFGGFSGRIVSETRTNANGDSSTKRK